MRDYPTLVFHKDERPIFLAFLQACHTRNLDPSLEVAAFMATQLEAWQKADTFMAPHLAAAEQRLATEITKLIQEYVATSRHDTDKETDRA